MNHETAVSLLEKTGIEIRAAENGLEAVAAAQRNLVQFDIIFVDIHMPELDGLEATRHIRKLNNPKAVTIPIRAITAKVFREDIERRLAAAMTAPGRVGLCPCGVATIVA